MPNYLIFIDLDGTLRNSSRQISIQTKEILKKTIDKNNRIIITSGRDLMYLKPIIKSLNIKDYLIASDGAVIYNLKEEKIIKEIFINEEDLKLILSKIGKSTYAATNSEKSYYNINKNSEELPKISKITIKDKNKKTILKLIDILKKQENIHISNYSRYLIDNKNKPTFYYIDIINKKSFYTKSCYGRGISYKLVEQNWNKPIDKISFEDLGSKFKHPMSWDDIKVKPATWNDGVKVIYESIVSHYKIIDEINKKKSEEYYQEALAKVKQINESSNLVNNWREGKHIKNKTVEYQYWRDNTIVEYQSWIKSYKEGIPGHWITSSIYIKDITFSNTQLRLTNNRQTVNTSKYANVSLEDAIKMWKFYIAITKDRVGIEGQPIMIRLEDRHYNVGIYNLRAIQYNQKKTDDGKLLDKWEWCVVIGCHYIWIDDFMDFIKYYNLYSIFDIKVPEEENKEQVKLNKPFKIKIK